MSNSQDIWNVLHDGTIAGISGSVPGEVKITVLIPYLRRMFADPGDSLIVTLHHCRRLEYFIWNVNRNAKSWQEVVDLHTDILNMDSEAFPLSIETTQGTLQCDYDDLSIQLDNGRDITFQALVNACDQYWDNWEKRGKKP